MWYTASRDFCYQKVITETETKIFNHIYVFFMSDICLA